MDLFLFNLIRSFEGKWSLIDWGGVLTAQYLPYVLVVAALVFLFRMEPWKVRVETFLATALALLISRGFITELLRFVWNRPRPFVALNFMPLITESSASFPSGHATFFFALAAALFAVNRKWGWWFFALALLNGFARIYAGVHWPSDVLGGAVVGIGSYFIVDYLMKKAKKQKTALR